MLEKTCELHLKEVARKRLFHSVQQNETASCKQSNCIETKKHIEKKDTVKYLSLKFFPQW